jgi:hypothetical protein
MPRDGKKSSTTTDAGSKLRQGTGFLCGATRLFGVRKQRLLELVCLGLVLLLGGCTGAEHLDRDGSSAVAGEVKLSDAKPLGDLETDDDVQVNLTDKLDLPLVATTVYFGEADAYDSDDDKTPVGSIPIIAQHVGSQWKAVPVAGPGLADAGWKYVAGGPGPREVWGVLDTSAGDSQADFVVAHSVDGAMSFSLQKFHKPTKLAAVYDFAMSRRGQGRVTLSLDTDTGHNKAGLYHYRTSDDGKTWSNMPEYEPDAMVRADTVTDDEQPAPAEKPLQTLYIRKAHRLLPQKRWSTK